MESEGSLEKIIKGCCKRRRKSQKKLYKMFYAYGMSITLRYSESREEAAEILNDAFMKVFTNIKDFNREKPFKPWLRRIIINTAINQYLKNKQFREKESVALEDQSIRTREKILPGISYDEIIEMVQQLSPSYRTVFNLYVIEGFKHREIAEMLDIAVGTSKSNLAKAKKNLQAILEKNFI
ncbi:MAG: RNA polymerase sigma factor [Balneolaceae bacterium]|nr:RNA polymerase sigma factor [Balneolaceae bacterium]